MHACRPWLLCNDGAGAEYVDRSEMILVFCTQMYLASKACARELFRAIDSKKPLVTVLEPDSSRGGLSREAIEAHLRDGMPLTVMKDGKPGLTWAQQVAAWDLASEMPHVASGEEIAAALFDGQDLIEWNRLSAFQDVSMRLIAKRLLIDDKEVYLQGEAAYSLPKALPLTYKRKFHLYASPYHPRAAALCEELAKVHKDIEWTQDFQQVSHCCLPLTTGPMSLLSATS